jgi:YHS domain-containing protein
MGLVNPFMYITFKYTNMDVMRNKKKQGVYWRVAVLFITSLFLLSAWAIQPIYTSFGNKAIRGYDPVAYFTQSQAVKGNKDIQYTWNGARWYFSSFEHKTLFIKDPSKYIPQYGGYCAWAVSQGYTAKVDPRAWYIHQGKLYLNYSKSIQKAWQKDVEGHILQGNQNWPMLLEK